MVGLSIEIISPAVSNLLRLDSLFFRFTAGGTLAAPALSRDPIREEQKKEEAHLFTAKVPSLATIITKELLSESPLEAHIQCVHYLTGEEAQEAPELRVLYYKATSAMQRSPPSVNPYMLNTTQPYSATLLPQYSDDMVAHYAALQSDYFSGKETASSSIFAGYRKPAGNQTIMLESRLALAEPNHLFVFPTPLPIYKSVIYETFSLPNPNSRFFAAQGFTTKNSEETYRTKPVNYESILSITRPEPFMYRKDSGNYFGQNLIKPQDLVSSFEPELSLQVSSGAYHDLSVSYSDKHPASISGADWPNRTANNDAA